MRAVRKRVFAVRICQGASYQQTRSVGECVWEMKARANVDKATSTSHAWGAAPGQDLPSSPGACPIRQVPGFADTSRSCECVLPGPSGEPAGTASAAVSHDGGVAQPPVSDYRAIIDAVRRHGSVHYLKVAVPAEFTVWRRRVRQVARIANLRISVTRSRDFVIIENLDFEFSDEDTLATHDVIEAHLNGQNLSFDDAVRARGRQRLRIVPTPGQEDDGP